MLAFATLFVLLPLLALVGIPLLPGTWAVLLVMTAVGLLIVGFTVGIVLVPS